MPTVEKQQAIDEFKQRLSESRIAIATNFIGINALQSTELRKRLRDQGVQFKVFKNTLVERALNELGISGAVQYLDGPTAWAFSKDPVVPTKVLLEFGKEVDKVAMRGGVLDGQPLSQDQLKALSSLPPREVLLAQTAGTMAAPLRNFVGVLSAPIRDMVNVLEQIRKQREEQTAA